MENRAPVRRVAAGALVCATAVLCAACISSTPEPTLPASPKRAVAPVSLGVFYSSEFRAYRHRHHATDTAYLLGEPSVELLNSALARRFRRVVEVADLARARERGDLVGTIAVTIEDARYEFPAGNVYTALRTDVTYGFRLLSPEGAVIAKWQTWGRGSERSSNPFAGVSTVTLNFKLAIQMAAEKLVYSFDEEPELSKWFEAQGLGATAESG